MNNMMKSISFVQFLMPDGKEKIVTIDRPIKIFNKYVEICKKGYRLEIEMLSNYTDISMTCSPYPRTDEQFDDIAHEICTNGPEVLKAVDKLISDSYDIVMKLPANSK